MDLFDTSASVKQIVSKWSESTLTASLERCPRQNLLPLVSTILLAIKEAVVQAENDQTELLAKKVIKCVSKQLPVSNSVDSAPVKRTLQLDFLGKSKPKFRPPASDTSCHTQPTGKRAVSAKWTQLHWSTAAGQPVSVGSETQIWEKKAAALLKSAVEVFGSAPDSGENRLDCRVSGRSVFDTADLGEQELQTINNIENNENLVGFLKKSKSSAKEVKKERQHVDLRLAGRESVLGRDASQRIGITINALKRNYKTLDAFKTAFLECNLLKPDLSLLMNTIPDEENVACSKKVAEWTSLIEKVNQLRTATPDVSLNEDEDYVYFLSCIPGLRQRLETVYIMTCFEDLTTAHYLKLQDMMRGLKIVGTSTTIKVLFQSFLRLGNILNEDTTKGNRNWFRLDDIPNAVQVRATNGYSFMGILAETVGPILDEFPYPDLVKARDAHLCHTIDFVSEILNCFLTAPDVTDSLPGDRYLSILEDFAASNRGILQQLLNTSLTLLSHYAKVCVYVGDPEACIPIDRKCPDELTGVCRTTPDLFCRMVEFVNLCKITGKHKNSTKPSWKKSGSATPRAVSEGEVSAWKVDQRKITDKTPVVALPSRPPVAMSTIDLESSRSLPMSVRSGSRPCIEFQRSLTCPTVDSSAAADENKMIQNPRIMPPMPTKVSGSTSNEVPVINLPSSVPSLPKMKPRRRASVKAVFAIARQARADFDLL